MTILASSPYAQELAFWAEQTTQLASSVSAAGANTLIVAPTLGKRLVLMRVFMTRAAGSVAETTCTISDSAGIIGRCVLNNYSPFVNLFDAQSVMQMRQLTRNSALTLTLSAANPVEIIVRYVVVE